MLALALLTLAHAGPAAASPPVWRVDTARSRLVVHVYRKGLLSPLLHDHHFVPARWQGSVAFDRARPERADVRITVAADSLRDRQPKLSAKDIRTVEEQVRGPKVLDAARYPEVRFVADRLQGPRFAPQAGGVTAFRGVLAATLTLHGRSRRIDVPVSGRLSATALQAGGKVSFKQSDFGIRPLRRAAGAIAVEDRVTVEFEVMAAAASPAG